MPELCGLVLWKTGADWRLLFPSDFSDFKWILSICSMYKRHHSSAEDCNFSCLFFPFFLQRWRWKAAGLSFRKCLAFRICCTKCHTLTTALSKERLLHAFLLHLVCTMISRSSLSFCTEGLYSLFLSRRIFNWKILFHFSPVCDNKCLCNRLLNN